MEEEQWPVLESKTEYENCWYRGGYDLVEQPDGSSKKYYWADISPAVVIIPRLDDSILFVKQYRPTIRQTHLELPAGVLEEGESFLQAARRELEEETGYRTKNMRLLQEYWVATGVLKHRRGLVYADELTYVGDNQDSSEFLELEKIPVEEAIAAARKQPAHDAALTGLLLAKEDGLL
jgi:ADP-ribose pyrophosphatase